MLEQFVRTHYQRWFVDHIAKRIFPIIHPIQVTLMAGIFGILIVPALAFHYVNLAILLLLISGFLDTLDGTLARYGNCTSTLGALLDITIDRTVEFAVIMGLWSIDPSARSLMCLLMLGCILLCVTSFLTVAIFTPNDSHKSFYYSPGIIERAEAFIFFIIMMLAPAYFTVLAITFCCTVILTTIIRMVEFAKITRHYEKTW